MQDRLQKMIYAIQQDGQKKQNELLDHERQHLRTEKAKTVNLAKDKINNEFTKKQEEYLIAIRIEQSKLLNMNRLRKMQARHELIEKVQLLVGNQFSAIIKDVNKYKALLQKLILQCLIKLLENEVELKCLKKDVEIIKSVIPDTVEQYKQILKQETGKDFELVITINEQDFIPDSRQFLQQSIGGVILSGFNGRIVCSNTIKNRIELTFQQYLPYIKQHLFSETKNIL